MPDNPSPEKFPAEINPAAGATHGTEPLNRKATGKLIQDYFSEQHDKNLKEHLKARLTTLILRWVVGLAGAALFAGPIVRVILTEETDRQILSQPDGLVFLLPGLVLLLISFFETPWSRGWPAPMFLAIAVAAFDVYYFDTGPEWLIPLMVVIAALAFVAALVSYQFQQMATPKPLKELEKEIDELMEKQFREMIREAREKLPIPAHRLEGPGVQFLKSFPKMERLNRPEVLARVGTDKIPRVSPIGVVAIDFGTQNALVLEGAVDLKSGDCDYMTVHQFDYRDISAITWSGDAWMLSGGAAAGSPQASADQPNRDGAGSEQRATSRKPAPRREELAIRLRSHHDVTFVLRDALVSDRLKDKSFGHIERIEKVRAVWERLANARAAAPG
jgi:hypothetical protein